MIETATVPVPVPVSAVKRHRSQVSLLTLLIASAALPAVVGVIFRYHFPDAPRQYSVAYDNGVRSGVDYGIRESEFAIEDDGTLVLIDKLKGAWPLPPGQKEGPTRRGGQDLVAYPGQYEVVEVIMRPDGRWTPVPGGNRYGQLIQSR